MKKWIAAVGGVCGVVLVLIGVVMKLKDKTAASAVSIIGGADGPTSVFIAGKVGGNFSAGFVIAGLMLVMIAGILLFILRKK